MQGLRDNPAWGIIGVILGVIGNILTLFADAPAVVKGILSIAGLLACVYFLVDIRTAKPVVSQQKVTPLEPANSTHQDQPQHTQYEHAPDVYYPQPHPHESNIPPVTQKPGNVNAANNADLSLPLWSRVIMAVVFTIMFGIPGVLLFRSGILWQHIVGIVLLICLVMFFLEIIRPGILEKISDTLDKFTNKLSNVADKLTE